MDKHGRVGWIFSSLRVVSSIVISRGNGNEVIGWFCLVFDLSFRTFGGRVGGDGTLEGDKRCLSIVTLKWLTAHEDQGYFSLSKIEKHTFYSEKIVKLQIYLDGSQLKSLVGSHANK